VTTPNPKVWQEHIQDAIAKAAKIVINYLAQNWEVRVVSEAGFKRFYLQHKEQG